MRTTRWTPRSGFSTTTVKRTYPSSNKEHYPSNKPGYRIKRWRGTADWYTYGKEQVEVENFDGRGSKRVVVRQGYDVWGYEYYTRRAVEAHRYDRRLETRVGTTIQLLGLGAIVVGELLKD